jgi:UbiD family decarboxylase
MHPSLRTFLDLLNRENEIVTIKAEVDPYLELAEIHRRVISEGGPALLFERVKGSRYPVVTNMFGTERRIDLAFGPKPEWLVRELVHIAESILPPSFRRSRSSETRNNQYVSIADHTGRRSSGASGQTAGVDDVAGRWWSIHYAPARLYRASGN